ncbi:UNVERIFIED_CONTAM: hypothetical protein PYX00_002127 [Menopon gallinae]|uniref:Uncharacterized protein n=1 Tax=Menopon gallinae TaxID=328185 RepID=A0AAW2IF50_9NEOP
MLLTTSGGNMNMNVKMDGEEEQSVHFPNRATIALQSGSAAYINLNLMNSNLSNSGYILNPVSTVPQNLVAYQSPVALQSYFTLQEADGNLVNNLQVGVPVPIGLPVPAELLQNPNLVNTSIIIGNEDCNQPVIFKPAANNVSDPNDIKISYMPKPIVQEVKPAITCDDQNIRLTDITGVAMENVLKKPCPLEMSIKAANIDLEFEKCDPDDLLPDSNGLLQGANYPIIHKLPIQDQIPENVVLNVPVKLCDKSMMPIVQEEVKKQKTEITWENNGLQEQAICNEFRESLICEVEEANEDEDERDDEKNGSSADENESLPPHVVLTVRRVQDDEDGTKVSRKKDQKKSQKEIEQDLSDSKKFMKVRHCCSKKECFKKITLKDQKTAHKNFYELESTAKQDSYLINCIEHVQTNRANTSEHTKDCGELKDKSVDRSLLDAANIQLEIENESNGNQMLSDEIQKAIKESLMDCMVNQAQKENENVGDELEKKVNDGEAKENSEDEEDVKTQYWNYYLVIDRCRKRVCLQFLLKLFRITKARIKTLQGKILSGQPLCDDSSPFTTNDETFDVWDFARIHVNTLASEEHPLCRSNRRHRYLNDVKSVEELFDKFKEFYQGRAGNELGIKISAYKRFLRNDAFVSLAPNKPGSCSECDIIQEEEMRNKKAKAPAIQNNVVRSERSFQTRKKGRRKWEISSDSECSSDDEPLVKRQNLKLKISLKDNKIQNSNSPDDGKKSKKKAKKETRAKGNTVRGRDVWSLMLLHLETMPYKICKSCVSRKRHRFFDASMTKQALYEDYRKYFLKETNSELGLGFSMYEKYFDRNCGYTIGDVDENSPVCPRCALEPPKRDSSKSSDSSGTFFAR